MFQVSETPLIASTIVGVGIDVKVHIEADLLGVEGHRAVHVGDGKRDQLELPIHIAPFSFRVVITVGTAWRYCFSRGKHITHRKLLSRSLEHFAYEPIVVDGARHRDKHPFWARNKAPQ